jgi:transcriptional regulator of heat shock response
MGMISNRQNSLLNFIVREYVKTAKPVPSSIVSKKSRLKVSPATIRNEMNELEAEGFLAQRHTSGGRVPTDKAYRYFVNNLLATEDFSLSTSCQKQINQALNQAGNDPRTLNKTIAQTLSQLSENLVITGIEEQSDFFKVGLTSLLEMPEFKEIDRIFQLTSFFEEFDELFNQIESQILHSIGLEQLPNIFIGEESIFMQTKDETVMMAKYSLPQGYIGSLALIGPTRMDYEKNISLIKYTTEKLEKFNHI